ncbi:hypothetical protein HK100_004361 [Physocladia obscura]|uniref:Enoyl reductase (ER) domain-containing protein n=1 Tax=Physocladia obscura TaxID=109957 RepID=A0AAD5XFS3_9FUNG|nr:hypothetical protein HK100_004361 [Physocladia obscura]
MSEHKAAISNKRGEELKVATRPTPTPGPGEVLIQVKSVALNPIDHVQRDTGFQVAKYPAIFGYDIAGVIAQVGTEVSDFLAVGKRVAAYSFAFDKKGAPDYGGFQEYTLVPAEVVAPIPEDLTFNEATLLPMAVHTAWAGFYQIGIDESTLAGFSTSKTPILVWGASSSIGSNVLQILTRLGFIVYATASKKNHEYLTSLAASPESVKLFDYKSPTVVEDIISATKANNSPIELGYLAAGDLNTVVKVLNATKPTAATAKLAVTPFTFNLLLWKLHTWRGVQATFVAPPTDAAKALEFRKFVFGQWLKEALVSKTFTPAPKIKILNGGLEGIQNGLEELKAGVNLTKLVAEISK